MDEAKEPDVPGQTNIRENDRAGLKGWAYLEEWMTTLDKGMVSDLNEDINTLLTFAGLFSAVLAGFLIQLYVGLQPSNNQETNNILTQTSLELRQVSRQLANSSFVPVDIPLPSPSFQASASTVWINTLWFLSLILSLASALFGMISKQWLREYLQWTTLSGLSETQIALRQGRYEAFNDWKTPAIIASMPVLLELALILFLLGMEILLWTLNAVVFGVCTVAVATLIILVIAVTVLPAFRARCPYKSPVGWICVLAKAALSSLLCGCWYMPVLEKDWRERDLALQKVTVSATERYNGDAEAAGRHQMLTKALWWVRGTSQDQRLMHAVDECVATFATNNSQNIMGALAVDFLFACEHLGIDSTQLVPSEDHCADVDEKGRVLDISYFDPWSLWFRLRLAGNNEWEERTVSVYPSVSVCLWIADVLACDLLAVVARSNTVDRVVYQTHYFLQASISLVGQFAYFAVRFDRRRSAALARLAALFDHLCRGYDTLPLWLRPLLPLLLKHLELCDEWLSEPLWPTGDFQRTRNALRAPTGQPGTWSEADCSLFLSCLVSFAWREWKTEHNRNDARTLLPQLFDRMRACVLRCLDQCWKDCSMPYSDLSWISELRRLFDPDPSLYNQFSGQHLDPDLFPHALVEVLNQFRSAGLVTSNNRSEEIMALVKRSSSLGYQHATAGDQADNTFDLETQYNATSSGKVRPDTAKSSRSTVHPPESPSQAVDPSIAVYLPLHAIRTQLSNTASSPPDGIRRDSVPITIPCSQENDDVSLMVEISDSTPMRELIQVSPADAMPLSFPKVPVALDSPKNSQRTSQSPIMSFAADGETPPIRDLHANMCNTHTHRGQGAQPSEEQTAGLEVHGMAANQSLMGQEPARLDAMPTSSTSSHEDTPCPPLSRITPYSPDRPVTSNLVSASNRTSDRRTFTLATVVPLPSTNICENIVESVISESTASTSLNDPQYSVTGLSGLLQSTDTTTAEAEGDAPEMQSTVEPRVQMCDDTQDRPNVHVQNATASNASRAQHRTRLRDTIDLDETSFPVAEVAQDYIVANTGHLSRTCPLREDFTMTRDPLPDLTAVETQTSSREFYDGTNKLGHVDGRDRDTLCAGDDGNGGNSD